LGDCLTDTLDQLRCSRATEQALAKRLWFEWMFYKRERESRLAD
jgi:hypothetical protein